MINETKSLTEILKSTIEYYGLQKFHYKVFKTNLDPKESVVFVLEKSISISETTQGASDTISEIFSGIHTSPFAEALKKPLENEIEKIKKQLIQEKEIVSSLVKYKNYYDLRKELVK